MLTSNNEDLFVFPCILVAGLPLTPLSLKGTEVERTGKKIASFVAISLQEGKNLKSIAHQFTDRIFRIFMKERNLYYGQDN